MGRLVWVGVAAVVLSVVPGRGFQDAAQQEPAQTGSPQPPQPVADPAAQALVARLDLEKYKATIKGLTQFGDRRQGTDRNRAAVDWIEAQLKSYGCPAERIKYEYVTPQRGTTAGAGRGGRGRGGTGNKRPGQGGSTIFGTTARTGVNNDPMAQPDEKLPGPSTRSPRPTGRAKRSTAPRSGARIPARCTSSARTWTASATEKPPMTTDRGLRS
jgi:hypothetical protein